MLGDVVVVVFLIGLLLFGIAGVSVAVKGDSTDIMNAVKVGVGEGRVYKLCEDVLDICIDVGDSFLRGGEGYELSKNLGEFAGSIWGMIEWIAGVCISILVTLLKSFGVGA
jgi:hypothetical protein